MGPIGRRIDVYQRRARRALLGLAALCLTWAAPGPGRAEIVIGLAGALAGPAAWEGEQHLRGVEAAVADLNAAGGVLGEQLMLLIGDDGCDAGQAVAVARQLVAGGAVMVSGHVCSHASIAAAGVYDTSDVIMISPSSTSPRLTEELRTNVFRVCGRDDQQGAVAADYLAEHWDGRRIAIVHDDSVFAGGLAAETRQRLDRRGVDVTMVTAYPPALADHAGITGRIVEADIEVVYLTGYIRDVALIVRQLRERGSDVEILSAEMVGDEFWLIAGTAGEGTRFTFSPDPRTNPEAAPVVERLRREGFEPAGFTLHAYATVQVWAQAVERAGSLEPDAVEAALRGQPFDTVLGTIGFDERGDVTGIEVYTWYLWRDGMYLLAP